MIWIKSWAPWSPFGRIIRSWSLESGSIWHLVPSISILSRSRPISILIVIVCCKWMLESKAMANLMHISSHWTIIREKCISNTPKKIYIWVSNIHDSIVRFKWVPIFGCRISALINFGSSWQFFILICSFAHIVPTINWATNVEAIFAEYLPSRVNWAWNITKNHAIKLRSRRGRC